MSLVHCSICLCNSRSFTVQAELPGHTKNMQTLVFIDNSISAQELLFHNGNYYFP